MEDYSLRNAVFVIMVLATAAFGDDVSDRVKLFGVWQPAESTPKEAGAWKLESRGTDILRVTQSLGGQTLLEFECSTNGQECDVSESGKGAKVSLYFNGSKLVELETRGKQVVKRRFGIGEDGVTLEIEVIPITAAGKLETLRFRRVKP
jgi:hypothetical protein